MSHPEVARECREDGKGWRMDERGNIWPCDPQAFAGQFGASPPSDEQPDPAPLRADGEDE